MLADGAAAQQWALHLPVRFWRACWWRRCAARLWSSVSKTPHQTVRVQLQPPQPLPGARHSAAGRERVHAVDVVMWLWYTWAQQLSLRAAGILLAFQAAMTNWASATAGQNFIGWTTANSSVCSWTGVQCNTAGRVSSLCVSRANPT